MIEDIRFSIDELYTAMHGVTREASLVGRSIFNDLDISVGDVMAS